jgi:hypothetical protein
MTAPDHATSHSKNTLRERGHPYMRFDPALADNALSEIRGPVLAGE